MNGSPLGPGMALNGRSAIAFRAGDSVFALKFTKRSTHQRTVRKECSLSVCFSIEVTRIQNIDWINIILKLNPRCAVENSLRPRPNRQVTQNFYRQPVLENSAIGYLYTTRSDTVDLHPLPMASPSIGLLLWVLGRSLLSIRPFVPCLLGLHSAKLVLIPTTRLPNANAGFQLTCSLSWFITLNTIVNRRHFTIVVSYAPICLCYLPRAEYFRIGPNQHLIGIWFCKKFICSKIKLQFLNFLYLIHWNETHRCRPLVNC